MAGAESYLRNAKSVQRQFVVDIREYHFDPLADRDRAVAAADEARGEARALVELDLHDVVGRLVLERREPRLVHPRPGADAPAAGGGLPGDVVGEAERAHRPGRQMRLAARAA